MTNLSYGADNPDNPLVFAIRLEEVLKVVNERREEEGHEPLHIDSVRDHVERIQKDLHYALIEDASEAIAGVAETIHNFEIEAGGPSGD
jgi:hypothetical protein